MNKIVLSTSLCDDILLQYNIQLDRINRIKTKIHRGQLQRPDVKVMQLRIYYIIYRAIIMHATNLDNESNMDNNTKLK